MTHLQKCTFLGNKSLLMRHTHYKHFTLNFQGHPKGEFGLGTSSAPSTLVKAVHSLVFSHFDACASGSIVLRRPSVAPGNDWQRPCCLWGAHCCGTAPCAQKRESLHWFRISVFHGLSAFRTHAGQLRARWLLAGTSPTADATRGRSRADQESQKPMDGGGGWAWCPLPICRPIFFLCRSGWQWSLHPFSQPPARPHQVSPNSPGEDCPFPHLDVTHRAATSNQVPLLHHAFIHGLCVVKKKRKEVWKHVSWIPNVEALVLAKRGRNLELAGNRVPL